MSCKYRPIFTAALAACLYRCGPVGSATSEDPAGPISYQLARTATNKLTNTLSLNIPATSNYTFSIDGEDFDADIEKKKPLPPQALITFTYTSIATYDLQLRVYQSDGTVLIKDQLQWQYSDEVPPEPDVEFSEEATNDEKVDIWTSNKRGKYTREIWVEGDVIDSEKRFHEIPDTGSVPIILTDGDGIKNLTVHYRNIFGTEGSSVEMSILKKSVGPTNCSISSNTLVTATGVVKFEVSATNDGPLYYAAIGDVVGNGTFTKFTSLKTFDATLLGTDGAPNHVTVKLRDIAGNFCPEKSFDLTYDPNHEAQNIKIKDDALWTDNSVVTVLPHADYLPSDTVEMYIYGEVVSDSHTMQWLPYSSSTTVQLNPVDGNRYVKVKYRINGTTGDEKSVPIFLKPFIRLQGASSPYTLVPSEFAALSSMTITGCSETYNQVAFSSSLSCTPNAATITATYALPDGTSIQRSMTAPP